MLQRTCRRLLATKPDHPIRQQTHEALDKTVKGAEQVGEKVREAGEEVIEGGRKFWDRLKDAVVKDDAQEKVKEKLEERGYNK